MADDDGVGGGNGEREESERVREWMLNREWYLETGT